MSKPGVTVTQTVRPESMNLDMSSPSIDTLAALLPRMRYKEDWSFGIYAHAGSARSLFITVRTENYVDGLRRAASFLAIHPDMHAFVRVGETIKVDHYLPIPSDACYSTEEWERWVLDQIVLVETHEACEAFKVDGVAIFHPYHGNEGNPYVIPARRG